MKKPGEQEYIARIEEFFARGVSTLIDPGDVFKKKLIAKFRGEYKKDIVVKFGVDPTRADIHLGHAVALRKLRQLQDFGCKIVFLVGDVTAQIGDPTGRSKIRPDIAQGEVYRNMATFLAQIDKILLVGKGAGSEKIIHDNKFSWIKNSDWFAGVEDIAFPRDTIATLTIVDAVDRTRKTLRVDANSFFGKAAKFNSEFSMQINELGKPNARGITLINLFSVLRQISHAQLIERDMFQERLKSGDPLFMHEMLYPVLQGIDSQMIDDIYGTCDCEIGGSDQTFNMLMGRKIMEIAKKPPQSVLATTLLVGLDGKEKMSKSLDNYVGIAEPAPEMFGKIMSIPDELIGSYFELCTFMPLTEVGSLKRKLRSGRVNPRDIKLELGEQIVALYHGQKNAEEARRIFVDTFQHKKIPEDVAVISAKKKELLSDVLVANDVVSSKGEFRRLVSEGAVRKNGDQKITDPAVRIGDEILLRVGKHRFVRIVLE